MVLSVIRSNKETLMVRLAFSRGGGDAQAKAMSGALCRVVIVALIRSRWLLALRRGAQ